MNRTTWTILALATTTMIGMLSGPSSTEAVSSPNDSISEIRTEISQLRTQFNAEQLSRAVADSSQWAPDDAVEAVEGETLVAINGQCVDGSCSTGVVYTANNRSRWYPGRGVARLVSSRRSSARSRGGWYLGKNLGRVFGRRR